jgi:hypothetical protein
MKLVWKVLGYTAAIPIWIMLTAAILPMLAMLLLVISFMTGNWNWKRMLLESTPPRYVILPPPHRLRQMDEYEQELIRRIKMILSRRRRHDKVNWRRDGF